MGWPPAPVPHAVTIHRWEELTFLHWSYDPRVVQDLLPPGLEVDTFAGAAWVGLLPFRLRLRLARGPEVPWVSRFAETNVRTYVKGSDGGRGIWFFSLDAARLGAVAPARATYNLPYCWAKMEVQREGDEVLYRSHRRPPHPVRPSSLVRVEVGERIPARELGDLDHFFTARWLLYSPDRDGGLRTTRVEHPPWPLRRARLLDLDDGLIRAAGLPAPAGGCVTHHSDSLQVRMGPALSIPASGGNEPP